MPYEPDPGKGAPEPQRLAFQANREVRHTVIRVITAHLKKDKDDPASWQGLDLDFTSVVFDGGDFSGARFSGGEVYFNLAQFSGGLVVFSNAKFTGGTVDFGYAQFNGSRVDFYDARFSGCGVQFTFAEFNGGKVDFSAAQFSGSTVSFVVALFKGGIIDFSDARDWSVPPKFPWTDTQPPSVKLPPGAA
jgi:hypothetical protein